MSELSLFVSPTVVVGLDFGTTYSGFAFAHRSDPENVQLFFDWPHQSRPYCKTQTSLFYVPSGKRGEFELEDWGWTALDKYTDALQRFRSVFGSTPTREDVLREVGVYVTCFKLYLADPHHYGTSSILPADLPPCLTPERMIVDYLRCIADFIIDHLKNKYGKALTKRQVQWCLTVPAIWSESSKSKMESYAEKAGLVQGKHGSSRSEASAFPLKIILEPEAASFSCQRQLLMNTGPRLNKGDKFIVADIGGGTIDIVVHKKAEQNKHSVHEVCPSYGELGGGTFVDRNFFQFLKQTIGCFEGFKDEEPTSVHRILDWWLGPKGKCTFDGSGNSKFMEVPRKLSKAWKKYDKKFGAAKPGDFYEELEISEGCLKGMFETELSKVVELVNKELKPDVKYVFLVGGFADNSYVQKLVKAKLGGCVREIVSPPNPGAAICVGAVAIGFETGVVLSRISKKSYGIRTCPLFKSDDPPRYKFVDSQGIERCRNHFDVFVEKNESVAVNDVVFHYYAPLEDDQETMSLSMFSSDSDRVPRYTTDPSCEKLESYTFDINEDLHLGCDREVLVSMYFGRATIEVSAERVNFGSNRRPEKLYSVELDSTTSMQ